MYTFDHCVTLCLLMPRCVLYSVYYLLVTIHQHKLYLDSCQELDWQQYLRISSCKHVQNTFTNITVVLRDASFRLPDWWLEAISVFLSPSMDHLRLKDLSDVSDIINHLAGNWHHLAGNFNCSRTSVDVKLHCHRWFCCWEHHKMTKLHHRRWFQLSVNLTGCQTTSSQTI